MSDQQFANIADGDCGDHAADHQLQLSKSLLFEQQNPEDENGGDDHADQKRNIEKQRKADGGAEKFREICRHGGDFARDPHGGHDVSWKMRTAEFGEIAPRDNAEFRGHGLEQHGDAVGEKQDP